MFVFAHKTHIGRFLPWHISMKFPFSASALAKVKYVWSQVVSACTPPRERCGRIVIDDFASAQETEALSMIAAHGMALGGGEFTDPISSHMERRPRIMMCSQALVGQQFSICNQAP